MSTDPLRLVKNVYHRTIPELWKERIDLALYGESKMYRSCFKSTGSIFIHIPKAAGISVATAIYGRAIGHYRALEFKEISARHYAKYFSFTLTRNPWDRLVSAYSFVKQNGTDDVKPIPNDVYDSEYFDSFGSFVRRWLVHQNLMETDCVFWPQHYYICDDDLNCIVDYVGRLEKIDDSVKHIQKRIGRNFELPVMNQSNRKQYTSYYDDELIEIVADVYATDIEMFSYQYDC